MTDKQLQSILEKEIFEAIYQNNKKNMYGKMDYCMYCYKEQLFTSCKYTKEERIKQCRCARAYKKMKKEQSTMQDNHA